MSSSPSTPSAEGLRPLKPGPKLTGFSKFIVVHKYAEMLCTGVGFTAVIVGLRVKLDEHIDSVITVSGALVFVAGLAGLAYRSLQFRARNSVPIPSKAEAHACNHLNVRSCKPGECAEIADFMGHVFSMVIGKFTSISDTERRDAYLRFLMKQPNCIKLILEKEQIVGCSILLELTENGLNAYLDGQIRGFLFPDDLIVDAQSSSPPESPNLYWKTAFLWREGLDRAHLSPLWWWVRTWTSKQKRGAYLREVSINHLKEALRGRGSKALIVAPRNTEVGQRNILTMGARHRGKSGGNFDIYEINYRDPAMRSAIASQLLEEINLN
jgi:hypothetical protein